MKKIKGGFKDNFRERTMGYVLAGFGLVAGLAWNDAIKELIATLYPIDKDTIVAKFVYALIITFVLVAVTIYLMRLFKKKEEGK